MSERCDHFRASCPACGEWVGGYLRDARSRIFQLEAAVAAADAMSELLRGYDYSDGSLAGKLLAAYDAAKAVLERVKGDG